MKTTLPPGTVGILGGMGPAAGVDFIRLFVQACETLLKTHGEQVNDQAFPEHWLVQVPVPDRTAALLDGGATPLTGMQRGLRLLDSVGVKAVAIACNTAHAWHKELQQGCPQLELMNIVEQTIQALAIDGVESVGLLATLGTHRTGLYETALARAGIRCHIPRPHEQWQVMHGILEGVKAGNLPLAVECFTRVAEELVKRHGITTLVLACTELPLALATLPSYPEVQLIDPAKVLAHALAERAYSHTDCSL